MTRRIILVDIGAGLTLRGVLPRVALFAVYNATLKASGGQPPYTYAIVAGALPAGLYLDAATGIISGTATAAGIAAFTVRATDLSGAHVERLYSITVIAEPLTLSGDAPNGQVGVPYSFNYAASGGVPPYVFDIASGVLPAGLSINAATGALTGTPTNAGSVFWTVRVTDTEGATTIADGAVISYPALALAGAYAAATVGTAYSSDLTISGGDGTYSNPRVTLGALPAGLVLSVVSGKLRLSGMPTTAGTSNFTVAVDSGDGQTAASAQSVNVSAGSLYASDGSTLAGWTAVGTSSVDSGIGNPSPSIKQNSGGSLRRLVTGATRWKLDIRTPQLCDFQFMCDAAGAGVFFRVDTRAGQVSGKGSTTGWNTFTAAPAGANAIPARIANTWYTYEFIYNSTAHTIDVKENGITILSGLSVPFPPNGDWIGLCGDGAGTASNFDNILIS